MPNWCEYEARFVCKDKSVLDRIRKIMNYEDTEYYLYRVESAECYDEGEYNGINVMTLNGNVAWAVEHWFKPSESNQKSKTGASYITMDELSKKLDFAVEIFGREEGGCFAEHIICCKGKVLVNETTPYGSFYVENDNDYENVRAFIKENFILSDGQWERFEKAKELYGPDNSIRIDIGGFTNNFLCDEELLDGWFSNGITMGMRIIV